MGGDPRICMMFHDQAINTAWRVKNNLVLIIHIIFMTGGSLFVCVHFVVKAYHYVSSVCVPRTVYVCAEYILAWQRVIGFRTVAY